MSGTHPQDVDWDRLDKKKFFVVGVGMFSGVTTVLYPLSVIKTRQMAAHRDVAAGLAGTKQIARHIWAQEGVRGFYRGFGTVVFGTIPARSVYLTTLEVTKAAVTKLGERLDISAPALAGAASFMGGAAASASTQAVVVPIDVISQRLMMQGVPHTSNNTSSSSGPTSRRVLEGLPQQQHQHPQQQPSGGPVAASSGQLGQAGVNPAVPPQQQAAAAAAPQQPPGSSRGLCTSSHPAAAGPRQQPQQQQLLQQARPSPQLQQQQQPCRGSVRQLSSVASVQHMNGFRMARLIVQEEGVRGLYRGFWPSLATFVPNSALWWGAYGFWQRFIWEQLPAGVSDVQPSSSGSSSSSSGGSVPSTGTVVAVQTTAAVLSGCTASVLTNPLDLVKTRLQVAAPVNGVVPTWSHLLRELLQEEGVRGLMRGVAPRMASSAMWGTCMVSVYEFLKRSCQKEQP